MLKNFSLVLLAGFLCSSCALLQSAPAYKAALEYSKATSFKPGKLVIVQGPTGKSETNINVLSPRLKNYTYKVTDVKGTEYKVELYETLRQEPLHWKIDKLYISGLSPKQLYKLEVVDVFRSSSTVVDSRDFETLNTESDSLKFAYASCMADDYRFNEVINPMWAQMQKQNPDLVILNGDLVYVDSFEFVERQKATTLDIWFRFIDSLNRLPIYKWTKLKPILATWDDHDFGTNDGNRNFMGKQAAREIFLAFFGGRNIEKTYELENDSVYFTFRGFKQKMLFLDDRYFREPNKEQSAHDAYAHWGQKQHEWVIKNLNENDAQPVWLFNGNQFFSGVDLSYKESFQGNNPEHFKTFLEQLKTAKSPVIFGSGDIHFSEIMQIPADRFGYVSYELTSSSMHSYTGTGWDNPLRLPNAFTKEFNFMMVQSKSENGGLKLDVESWGLTDKPLFKQSLKLSR